MFLAAGLQLDAQETVLRKPRGGGPHENSSSFESLLCVYACVYTGLTVDLRNSEGFDAALSS